MYFDYDRFISEDTVRNSEQRLNNSMILTKAMMLLRYSSESDVHSPYVQLLNKFWYTWCPDYFFTSPASSTGKYHPAFANRSNGLLLHSLAVTRIAADLYNILTAYDDDNKSINNTKRYNNLICAAFFHDMFKYGDPSESNAYTCHAHPEYASDFFKYPPVIDFFKSVNLTEEDALFISDLIKTHMGPYTTSKYSDIVLTAPRNSYELLLHTADMLSSRKENDIVNDVLY